MIALNPDRKEELDAFERRYWSVVRSTLATVFEADPGLATQYQHRIADAPPLQRALALHDDPLDLAATLTGQPPMKARVVLYDLLMRTLAERDEGPSGESSVKAIPPREILSSARRDESAPMVAVITLNKFLGELGYHRLTVRNGVAYFQLERKAWKRPLPKRLDMETLPGLNADKEEVYRLDRVLNVLNGLQEFARRRKPESSIVARLEKIKERLRRTLTPFR